jgi:hypothetical protein
MIVLFRLPPAPCRLLTLYTNAFPPDRQPKLEKFRPGLGGMNEK